MGFRGEALRTSIVAANTWGYTTQTTPGDDASLKYLTLGRNSRAHRQLAHKFSVPLGAASAERIRVLLNPRATRIRQILGFQQLIAQCYGFIEVAGLGPAACRAKLWTNGFSRNCC